MYTCWSAKICFEVEQKDKLLASKWDSVQKHVDHKKTKKALKGVKNGEWYMAKDCKHVKNETTYACKGKELMLQ